MNYAKTAQKLKEYRGQIADLRKKMRKLHAEIEPEEVKDYEFTTADSTTRLSQLFGKKDTLFVVHNMGAGCPYCTLWADGFNGAFDHLQSRAAFVVASPDPPDKQKEFAQSRGWKFPMVSYQGTDFAADMGYRGKSGYLPGVSVFKRKGKTIVRVADTSFSPGDDFCFVWHFFDLIPEGAEHWQPKYKYAS
jgi:predicted dithiol-disulfide oxidoreductase (DUF899 family)